MGVGRCLDPWSITNGRLIKKGPRDCVLTMEDALWLVETEGRPSGGSITDSNLTVSRLVIIYLGRGLYTEWYIEVGCIYIYREIRMEFVESLIGNVLLRNWKEDFEYLIVRRLVISLERELVFCGIISILYIEIYTVYCK